MPASRPKSNPLDTQLDQLQPVSVDRIFQKKSAVLSRNDPYSYPYSPSCWPPYAPVR
jgi:hypothetical protein